VGTPFWLEEGSVEQLLQGLASAVILRSELFEIFSTGGGKLPSDGLAMLMLELIAIAAASESLLYLVPAFRFSIVLPQALAKFHGIFERQGSDSGEKLSRSRFLLL
jgi:hypothetical protein